MKPANIQWTFLSELYTISVYILPPKSYNIQFTEKGQLFHYEFTKVSHAHICKS